MAPKGKSRKAAARPAKKAPQPKRKATIQGKGKNKRVISAVQDSSSNGDEGSDDSDSQDQEETEDESLQPRKKQKQMSNVEPEEGAQEILYAQHNIDLPDAVNTKTDAADVNLLFSDNVEVRFHNGEKSELLKGRWCLVCKENSNVVKNKGLRKCFQLGGTSACRVHARTHYPEYAKRCKDAGIPEHHWAVPRKIFKQREKEAGDNAQGKAGTLVATGFKLIPQFRGPEKFSKESVLENVARFIVCTDQSFATAGNLFFRNSLVSMRPFTKSNELPSTHKVTDHLHNEFIKTMEAKSNEIKGLIGLVCVCADMWSSPNNKTPYMGSNGAYIVVTKRKNKRPCWTLKNTILGFRAVEGAHDGENLGRYLFSIFRRAGIIDVENKVSKLGHATFDNATNNDTSCETIEKLHVALDLRRWDANSQQLMCLSHVTNLGTGDTMTQITKEAAFETSQAIWEYDPSDSESRVLGNSLDVIAALRTLSTKIQVSGQRIQEFHKIQCEFKIDPPLSLILHGNTRWGSAFGMVDRGLKLAKAIDRFIAVADALFGPISIIRKNGKIVKKIPWSAFKFTVGDWARVSDCRSILEHPARIQQLFSSSKNVSIYKAIPAIEKLLTQWENKRKDPKFELYHAALDAGLAKMRKYYIKFDEKPAYILSLFIHPYYKLHWIDLHWGGAEAQKAAIDAGDYDAKNWIDEAGKIVEAKMEEYWDKRNELPTESTTNDISSDNDEDDEDEDDNSGIQNDGASSVAALSRPGSPHDNEIESDTETPDVLFAKFRAQKMARAKKSGYSGWETELRSWNRSVSAKHTADMDLCKYWEQHAHKYPTIARMAVDILPVMASSVPSERLFSSSGHTADDQRSRLGSERFEQAQVMKWHWKEDAVDFAKANQAVVEDVDLSEFQTFLRHDEEEAELDNLCSASTIYT